MSQTYSLSDLAAEEIRGMLGRRNLTKSALSRQLGVSHTWVTNRLAGHQEITLNELQRIAAALEVPVSDLLPKEAVINRDSSQTLSEVAATRPSDESHSTVRLTPTSPTRHRRSGDVQDARKRPRQPGSTGRPPIRPRWTNDGVTP